jgi:hypothetical protein
MISNFDLKSIDVKNESSLHNHLDVLGNSNSNVSPRLGKEMEGPGKFVIR